MNWFYYWLFEFQDWHENIANACVSSDVALSHQAGGKQVIIEPTEADSAPSQTPAKPGICFYDKCLYELFYVLLQHDLQ